MCHATAAEQGAGDGALHMEEQCVPDAPSEGTGEECGGKASDDVGSERFQGVERPSEAKPQAAADCRQDREVHAESSYEESA